MQYYSAILKTCIFLQELIRFKDKNVYLFSSAAMLAKALSEIKDIYTLEDIRFNPQNIMTNRRIDSIVPESLTEDIFIWEGIGPPELLN
jgi:hypothetical protein